LAHRLAELECFEQLVLAEDLVEGDYEKKIVSIKPLSSSSEDVRPDLSAARPPKLAQS
jgi:hypothetical protein